MRIWSSTVLMIGSMPWYVRSVIGMAINRRRRLMFFSFRKCLKYVFGFLRMMSKVLSAKMIVNILKILKKSNIAPW